MENKENLKTSINLPKNEIENNKNNECSKLIPIKITIANQGIFIPNQNTKNTIFINDLETLNDSSFTNNFESISIKEKFRDSLSLGQSFHGSKTDLNIQKSESEKKKNFFKKKFNDSSIKKENNKLKKEINDLKKIISSMKDKESLYEIKILQLNDNYENLQKELFKLKKEFQLKEKEFLEKEEKLKNDIKNKETILNSLNNKIIYKNQIIQNFNSLINEKNFQINELNKKLNLKKKIDMNINNSTKSNYSYINSNKENENIDAIKNIKNNKNNYYIECQKNMNLEQFLKKFKLINKTKTKLVNLKRENKSMINIFQLNKIRNSNRDMGNSLQNNNNNLNHGHSKINKQKLIKNDISLKKKSKLNNKDIFNSKKNINAANEYFNNSSLNRQNMNNRNILRHISNFSCCYSFSNKLNDHTLSSQNTLFNEINNLSNNNLIQERNLKDDFLKRIFKNNKGMIKSSISDNTSSLLNIEGNEKNFKKKVNNNSLEFNLNNQEKKKNYININTKANNDNFFGDVEYYNKSIIQKNKIIKRKNNKLILLNNRKINNLSNITNQSFLNEIKTINSINTTTTKPNNCIKDRFRFKNNSLHFMNPIVDSNLNLTNNNSNKKNLDLSMNSFKTKEIRKINKNPINEYKIKKDFL